MKICLNLLPIYLIFVFISVITMSLKGDPVAYKVILAHTPSQLLKSKQMSSKPCQTTQWVNQKCVRRLSKASDQPSLLLLIKWEVKINILCVWAGWKKAIFKIHMFWLKKCGVKTKRQKKKGETSKWKHPFLSLSISERWGLVLF